MTKILIVWENVPEETRLYLLDVADEDVDRVVRCHGQIGGTVGADEDAVDWLSNYLADKPRVEIKQGVPVWLDGAKVAVHTGWML